MSKTKFTYADLDKIIKKYDYICGIDEVGRGSIAGPVVVAAIVTHRDTYIKGLKDSKKLSPQVREKFLPTIVRESLDIGIGIVHSEFIDKYGILNATKLAAIIAISNLNYKPDLVITDYLELSNKSFKELVISIGNTKLTQKIESLEIYSESIRSDKIPYVFIPKADELFQVVSMASVVAKVIRDRYMKHISSKYPYFSFNSNKGYCTKEHIESLKKHGLSELHRKTFLKTFFSSNQQITLDQI